MLRDYQLDAIEKTKTALRAYERVVVTAATGAGKSLLIAEIVSFFLARAKGSILILCHQAEILQQNNLKFKDKNIQTSIYCAGLKSKCVKSRVVLASRESAAQQKSLIMQQKFDLIIVDECHLVSENPETMYQKIFAACGARWVLGFTGSPYRLDNGVIFGKGKFWQKQSCAVTTEDLQHLGYLAHHTFPRLNPLIDTSKVALTGPEFNLKQLETVSSTPLVVSQCVAEWWRIARNRKLTMFFCVSLAHAALVKKEIQKYTADVTSVDGETDYGTRAELFDLCRKGRIKAIVNVGVLTTGIDIPITDCIVLMRATQSLSLFIQMVGRGLRIFEGKSNCLILDFAANWIRFGGLENPMVPRVGSTQLSTDDYAKVLALLGITENTTLFEAPKKECPQCNSLTATATKVCGACGHIYINHASDVHKTSTKYWQDKGYTVGALKEFKLTKKDNRNGKTYVEFFGKVGSASVITALPIRAPESWIRRSAIQKYEKLLELQTTGKQGYLAYKRGVNGYTNIEVIDERINESCDSDLP
jgi:DNA repair protein RadD